MKTFSLEAVNGKLTLVTKYLTGLSTVKKDVNDESVKALLSDTSKKFFVMRFNNTKISLNRDRVKFTKDANKADVIVYNSRYFETESKEHGITKKELEEIINIPNLKNHKEYINYDSFNNDDYKSLEDDSAIFLNLCNTYSSIECNILASELISKIVMSILNESGHSNEDIFSAGMTGLIRILKSLGIHSYNTKNLNISATWSGNSRSVSKIGKWYNYYKIYNENTFLIDDIDYEKLNTPFVDDISLSSAVADKSIVIDAAICKDMFDALSSSKTDDELSLYYNMLLESDFEKSEMYIMWIMANFHRNFEGLKEYNSIQSKTFVNTIKNKTGINTKNGYTSSLGMFDLYINTRKLTMNDIPEFILSKFIDDEENDLKYILNRDYEFLKEYMMKKHNI